ncbi:MAG TPA: galactokinase family protein [Gaiellaceae bacterium]|nr:galactokinase family protein [Gaiellaceae bacterium]
MREVAVRAPGRVNLIGDHTDYNDGFVLPIAIELDCRVHGRATDGELRLRWADGGDENSARIAAAVRERLELTAGLDADVHSTVPMGSGLSSSSALAVALGCAFAAAAGRDVEPRELARACQAAETDATGVPGGIMDQLTSVLARADHALLIDCRSLEVEQIPIPAGLGIVAVHSGLPRTLAGSAYAERRAACEATARRLGLAALRDATAEQVADDPFARHVVSENARVLAAAEALRTGDLEALATAVRASHASLRDDYEVSTPELDVLVAALEDAGALGARLTGAGFGGCVVALTARGAERDVAEPAAAAYRAATGREPTIYVCRAAAGAGAL